MRSTTAAVNAPGLVRGGGPEAQGFVEPMQCFRRTMCTSMQTLQTNVPCEAVRLGSQANDATLLVLPTLVQAMQDFIAESLCVPTDGIHNGRRKSDSRPYLEFELSV